MTRLNPILASLVLMALPAGIMAQTPDWPAPPPSPRPGPESVFAPAWGHKVYDNPEFSLSPSDFGSCAVDQSRGNVYCGVKSGAVVAYTLDGRPLWDFATRGAIRSRPVPLGDHVFVGSADGCIYRLAADTGLPSWIAPYCTDAAVYGGPTVDRDMLFFTVTTDKTYCLNADTGTFLWQVQRDRPRQMSTEGVAAPVVAGEVVLAGFSDGTLSALDRTTGREIWTADLGKDVRGASDVDATPLVSGDIVYASAFSSGPTALRLADGQVVWQARLFGPSSPLLMADLLVVGTSDGEVVGLDTGTGNRKFVSKLATRAAYQPVRVGNSIIVGGDRGLWALDASTGAPQVQLLTPFGVRSTLEVAGRRIFFVGGGGTVNAVDLLQK